MAATLDSIEGILSDIKTNVGGFINTTPKAKNNQVTYNVFNRGMENLLKKLDNIVSGVNGIKNASGSNNGGNSGNGKNIVSKISEMAGYTQTIDKNINQILSVLNSLNGNNANVATGSGSNVTNVPDELKHIDKNIEGVFNYVAQIVDLLSDKEIENSIDDETKEALKRIANEKSQEKIKDWDRGKTEREKKDLKEKIKQGGPEAKEAANRLKEILKQEQEQNKTIKKIEKKAEKGRGWKGIANVAGHVNDFLKADSAGAVADKGIGMISQMGPAGAAVGGILGLLKTLFELGSMHDRAGTDFAREVGGYRKGKRLAENTVQSIIGWDNMANKGYKSQDAYSAMTEASGMLGRTTERMSQESLLGAIDLKRFGIDMNAIRELDSFGVSIGQMSERFARVYGEASKKGLNFKNVSKAITDNLKAAQKYTFADGLKSIERMAERSVQFKYNMQQVFQLAEKTSTIEGGMQTSANLSVLGGNFAKNSNPMQFLYESLYDPEALQKRLEDMFTDMAHFDKDKGQFVIDATQRQFLNAASSGMGLDSAEMSSLALNKAKMRYIGKQIDTGVSEDVATYIKNIAEINENGDAEIILEGNKYLVKELDNSFKAMLQREFEEKEKKDKGPLGEIRADTNGIAEKLDNMLQYLKEKLGYWVYSALRFLNLIDEDPGEVAAGEGDAETKAARRELYEKHGGGTYEISKMTKQEALDTMQAKDEHTTVERIQERRQKSEQSANGIEPYIPKIGEGGFTNAPTHFGGGRLYELEKNEHVTPQLQSVMYNKELSLIRNGKFNPYSYANDLVKNNMEKYYGSLSVAPIKQNTPVYGNQPLYGNSQLSVNGRISIPETITIKIENGSAIGNLDTNAITSMVAMQIMQEWKKYENFSGFDKENFPYKNVIGV